MSQISKSEQEQPWWVYLLRLSDNSLYCGVTTDPKRRLTQHNQGKASKYTRTRLPAEMVFSKLCPCQTTALRLEKKIKGLSKTSKEKIVNQGKLPYRLLPD